MTVTTTKASPSGFRTAAEVMRESVPVEIVEGIAWAGHVSILVSESGTGKTFVALNLAAAVSAGQSWHGRYTEHGSVAYLSYESDALKLRFCALSEIQGHNLANLYVLRASDPLSPRMTQLGETPSAGELMAIAELRHLKTRLASSADPPIRLLVIDTVRASLAGSEDSSEHVSAYIRAVRRLMTVVPDAAAILVHHSGWQDGDTKRKRERGSSAWRGNCDGTLYLEATGMPDTLTGEARLTLGALKVRDDVVTAPLHFIRRRVELSERNRYGKPLTSCVIERDHKTREDRQAEQKQAAAAELQAADLRVLRAMRDYPEATSITRLRTLVGLRMNVVSEAVARILRQKWAIEGKRGQPYTITEAGITVIDGHPA